MKDNEIFHVIIIGGSYSGLSAAMALGRSMRKVLIIDGGLPCNRQTPHSHNFLTQDGETPEKIADKARAQLNNYSTVKILKDFAVDGLKGDDGFVITTTSGSTHRARKLLFATGIKDKMPAIKGFAECWGISVVHCPYCHGFELRDRKTGIMTNGERAFHLASLVYNLTKDVSILTSGKADFSSEQLAKLHKHDIKIIETNVAEIEHQNGEVRSVRFSDGKSTDFGALYAAIPFEQHSAIPVSLGCELNEHGYISINTSQKTTVNGVFACGDNSNMVRSVANAVQSGNLAGAMINRELTEEDFI